MLDFIHLQFFAEGGEGEAQTGPQAENQAAEKSFDVDAELERWGITKKNKGKTAASQDKAEREAIAAATLSADGGTGETQSAQVHQVADQSVAGTQQEDLAQAIQDLIAGRSSEELDKVFEGLVKGSMKEYFGKRVQSIINDRFPKAKKTEAQLQALKEAVQPYMEKFGLEPDDVEGLRAAAEKDKSNFAAAALKKGTTAEEEMEEFASRRKKEALTRAKAAQQEEISNRIKEQRLRQQMDRWAKEEAELKKVYPEFDYRKELAGNEEFAAALQAGVSMKAAYRGAHFDELLANVAGTVAQQAAMGAANAIQTNRQRPSETGLASGAVVDSPPDYAHMSDKDFMKILKQYL